MSIPIARRGVIVAIAIALCPTAAGGDTLLVPGQFSTIQAAINAPQSGDTIRAADDIEEMRVRTMFWIL